LESLIQNPLFDKIGAAADEIGVEAWLIGGYVRDALLQRPTPKDVDVVAIGSGIALAEAFAKKLGKQAKVTVFKSFGTAQVRYNDTDVEFVGARKESYRADSRKPIVEDGTLEDDQNRRDFTINALAVGLNGPNRGQLLDPFGGRNDLDNKIIRTPLDPDVTYSDDPLRMMRAIRFATQLQFTIAPESLQSIERNHHRLEIISMERIMVEFNKILDAPKPSIGLLHLYQTGLMHHFLPELIALKGVEEVEGQLHKDNFLHTLEVVDNIAQHTQNVWLRWAALLHDIGKAPTKKFVQGTGWTFHGHEAKGSRMVGQLFKRLKLPMNEKMKYVQKLVGLSSRPIALVNDIVTDSAVRRLLLDAGDDLDDLMTLCDADITTKNPQRKKRYRQNFVEVRQKFIEVEERDHIKNWQPPIDGAEIMRTFGLTPGKEVGAIKNQLKEAILEGHIPNAYEPARQWMVALGTQMGLQLKNNE
jgi:tRNA nucleotidyltransferase/poly(A) polymerase